MSPDIWLAGLWGDLAPSLVPAGCPGGQSGGGSSSSCIKEGDKWKSYLKLFGLESLEEKEVLKPALKIGKIYWSWLIFTLELYMISTCQFKEHTRLVVAFKEHNWWLCLVANKEHTCV